MATELKKIKLTSVDLVRAGANQEADIDLFKSADPSLYHDALSKSVRSILDDPALGEEDRAEWLAKTVEEYRAAAEELEPEEDGEPVTVEKEPEVDTIEEVEKSAFTSGDRCDMIVEVEKFNPFHDALGRFASANSFRTYSANPKSKDGAAAISRSAQAGHGSTWNVHRESKGENIGQNYAWLQGNQIPYSQRTGPIAGQGSKPTAQKPKQQKPKPQPQPTRQPQQQPQPTANNGHTMVSGKDISKTFKPDPNSKDSIGQQIAAMQGYLGKPRVVSSPEYDQASMASGYTAFRTIKPGADVKTGQRTSAKDFANQLLYGDASERSLNGTGAQAYGAGLYLAASKGNSNGFAVSPQAAGNAYNHSTRNYGIRGRSAVVEATLDPSAKIGDYDTICRKYNRLSPAKRARFGDEGGYAMALGYDALRDTRHHRDCDYLMVYNMTKVIARDTVGKY